MHFSTRFQAELTPNALTRLLQEKRLQGAKVLDLTASNPTAAGFAYDAKAVLDAIALPAALLYEPAPKGLPVARRAAAAYYEENGTPVDPKRIFITASTSEAYSYLFKLLCDPGDEVLIPRPGYPLFDMLAAQESVRPIPYPLKYDDIDGWQMDLEMLENSISTKTRALIVIHPNNPTGNFVKPRERETLNEISARHSLAIIADEVFSDYALDQPAERTGTFADNTAVPTFVLNGLSKLAGLPQMKLGWIHISGPAGRKDLVEQIAERLEFIADTYLSVSAPVQHGLNALLTCRGHIQAQIKRRITGNFHHLRETIAYSKTMRLLKQEGGWYAVIGFRDEVPDETRAVTLLEHDDLFIHPGYFYDFPEDGHMVISLLTRPDVFAEGIRRLNARFR